MEVDRSGEVVHRFVLPEAHRVEESEANPVVPEFVFDAGVDRCPEHLRVCRALHLVEFQHFEIEIRGLIRSVVGNRDADELGLLGRDARDRAVLVPFDESQVDDRQRGLQSGQDVVRGAQIDGKAVAGRFAGFEVEVAHFEGAGFGIRRDGGAVGRDVDRAARGYGPAVLLERDVDWS